MEMDAGSKEMRDLRKTLEGADYPETLGAFVRERAEAQGDAVLGVWFDEGQTLTYRELDEAADRMASSLSALGVRKGTHVAMMLPNVPAFPITWVALGGRIGAVMIPVNTGYTSEELNFVLSDSDSQFLVIDHDLLANFEAIEDKLPLISGAQVIIHGARLKGAQAGRICGSAARCRFCPPRRSIAAIC